jgi:hypothetical protein
MEGLTANSFLTSPLYSITLYAAILPSVYFIIMVVGGHKEFFQIKRVVCFEEGSYRVDSNYRYLRTMRITIWDYNERVGSIY